MQERSAPRWHSRRQRPRVARRSAAGFRDAVAGCDPCALCDIAALLVQRSVGTKGKDAASAARRPRIVPRAGMHALPISGRRGAPHRTLPEAPNLREGTDRQNSRHSAAEGSQEARTPMGRSTNSCDAPRSTSGASERRKKLIQRVSPGNPACPRAAPSGAEEAPPQPRHRATSRLLLAVTSRRFRNLREASNSPRAVPGLSAARRRSVEDPVPAPEHGDERVWFPFAPGGAGACVSLRLPGLTPWATFFRPCGARCAPGGHGTPHQAATPSREL